MFILGKCGWWRQIWFAFLPIGGEIFWLMFQKVFFTQAQALRCYLQQFIAVDIGHHIYDARGGTKVTASSAPEARTLVSFLPLSTLISRSLSRLCSPTIMP